MNYLKEGIDVTEEEIEYFKDQDAKVGHKTAKTQLFGYKFVLVISLVFQRPRFYNTSSFEWMLSSTS